MTDYAAMRALDVWYDRIDLEDVLKSTSDRRQAERIEARVEQARLKSAPDVLFPKLAEHVGADPKIKDDPPLIFHPTEELAPGMKSNYADAIAEYRRSLPEHVRVLFDRYQFLDLAMKVVGVGSVGTFCAVGLFMAPENDPIFLQIKEARQSVFEPFAGKSVYSTHGERVVAGQRIMQSASDIFLGWMRRANKRDYYMRQLRDVKISAVIEDWEPDVLRQYGKLCAWALARAHARSGDSAAIAGYMGSNSTFDDAVCEFAVEYADQNQRDYRAFVRGIREGKVKVAPYS
jgi:uncharacterized protein (DUF2252 family)